MDNIERMHRWADEKRDDHVTYLLDLQSADLTLLSASAPGCECLCHADDRVSGPERVDAASQGHGCG